MLRIYRRHLWLIMLIAAMTVAVTQPLQTMFYDHTSFAGDRPAPGALGPFLLIVLGWMVGVAIEPLFEMARSQWLVHGVVGLVVSFLWLSFEPAYHAATLVLDDPGKALTSNSFLFAMSVWGLFFWAYGAWLASDWSQLEGGQLRVIVVRTVVALGVVSIIVLLSDSAEMLRARQMMLTSSIIVLVLAIVTLLVAQARATRRVARSLSVDVPSWTHAARSLLHWLVAGAVTVVLVVLVMGRDGLLLISRAVVTVIQWFLTAINWVAGMLAYAIIPKDPPPIVVTVAASELQMSESAELKTDTAQSPAVALTWIGLALVVFLVFFFLARLGRHRVQPGTDEGATSKSSIFSFGLLRDQLRRIFGRDHTGEVRRVALDSQPDTVREAMLHLQALGSRSGTARHRWESAQDYIGRLSVTWPTVGIHLRDLGEVYEDTRYGETPDQLSDARAALTAIKASRPS